MAVKAAAVRMDAALEDRLLDEALREMEGGRMEEIAQQAFGDALFLWLLSAIS